MEWKLVVENLGGYNNKIRLIRRVMREEGRVFLVGEG